MRANRREYPKFKALGASVLFVSPQTPENTKATADGFNLEFDVLSDVALEAAKLYNLVYTMPEPGQRAYRALGLDVPGHNGNDSWQLPVPATYLIDKDGIIQYAFVSFDHTKRALPSEVLKKLKGITTAH